MTIKNIAALVIADLILCMGVAIAKADTITVTTGPEITCTSQVGKVAQCHLTAKPEVKLVCVINKGLTLCSVQ